MKHILNLIVACLLLLMGFVMGQMTQAEYLKGAMYACDELAEKAYDTGYESGLTGCVD